MKTIPAVFVVDDEESMRDSFQAFLTVLGYPVKTFASGNDFLEALDESWTGYVFVDLRMANMNGLELIERLRSRRSPLSAVLMTGNEEDVARQQALDAGAIEMLRKPFPIVRLREILQGGKPPRTTVPATGQET